MSAPSWLERPRYRERVVASKRGWIVERTGEVLVSVVNMDEKLRQYFGFDFLETPVVVDEDPKKDTPIKTEEPVVSEKETVVKAEEPTDQQPEPPKKKRGRPRKHPIKEETK